MEVNTTLGDTMTPSFIIIDDDYVNNLICRMLILNVCPAADIESFTEPQAGIAYIRSNYSGGSVKNAVLFLDINMPVMNGWQVLDEIKKMFAVQSWPISVYMLSSSVDPNDMQKATDPTLSGYIEKPLTTTKLQAILSVRNIHCESDRLI